MRNRQHRDGQRGRRAQLRAALAIWRQRIAEDPENPDLWVQVGHVYRRHGYERKAIEAYARATELMARQDRLAEARSIAEMILAGPNVARRRTEARQRPAPRRAAAAGGAGDDRETSFVSLAETLDLPPS